jgi:hypothetical protein
VAALLPRLLVWWRRRPTLTAATALDGNGEMRLEPSRQGRASGLETSMGRGTKATRGGRSRRSGRGRLDVRGGVRGALCVFGFSPGETLLRADLGAGGGWCVLCVCVR